MADEAKPGADEDSRKQAPPAAGTAADGQPGDGDQTEAAPVKDSAVEELQTKYEERLRAAQERMHAATVEAATLRGKMEAMVEQIKAAETRKTDPEETRRQREERWAEWREHAKDDIVGATEEALQALSYDYERKLETMTKAERQSLEKKIGMLEAELKRLSPEAQQYSKELEALRQDTALAGLPHDALLAVAKKMAAASGSRIQTETPPGRSGGAARASTGTEEEGIDKVLEDPAMKAGLAEMLGEKGFAAVLKRAKKGKG